MPDEIDADYFEIAKKLTREHSRVAGEVYVKNSELGIAREVIRRVVERLVYVAQMNHYGYHDQSKRWTDCDNPFCRDTAEVLESVGFQP